LLLLVRSAPTISPGRSGKVRVEIDRQGFRGPVELALRGLPGGMISFPTTLDGDEEEGELEVRVGSGVIPGAYPAVLEVRARGQEVSEMRLAVRVARAAVATTPPVPKPQPRPGPERPQLVEFVAPDQVALQGLLYPGSKGKKGACVLLVRDVG